MLLGWRAEREALALINTGREEADRVLLCVDSVHGFGINDVILGSWAAIFLWVTNGSSGRARDRYRRRHASGVGGAPADDPELNRQPDLARRA